MRLYLLWIVIIIATQIPSALCTQAMTCSGNGGNGFAFLQKKCKNTRELVRSRKHDINIHQISTQKLRIQRPTNQKLPLKPAKCSPASAARRDLIANHLVGIAWVNSLSIDTSGIGNDLKKKKKGSFLSFFSTCGKYTPRDLRLENSELFKWHYKCEKGIKSVHARNLK